MVVQLQQWLLTNGTKLQHSLKGYTPYSDAQVFNGGSRDIAFVDQLSDQEKEVYIEKINLLNKKKNFGGSIRDVSINFDTATGKDFVQDLKSIKSVTSRAFDLLYANYNYQKFNLCDWVIEPKELANYSTFETNKTKMDTIFEIGYNEAKKSFQELNL